MTWPLLVALWLLLMLVVLAFFAGARMLSDEDGESPLRTDETAPGSTIGGEEVSVDRARIKSLSEPIRR